jgi:hypothetical protein
MTQILVVWKFFVFFLNFYLQHCWVFGGICLSMDNNPSLLNVVVYLAFVLRFKLSPQFSQRYCSRSSFHESFGIIFKNDRNFISFCWNSFYLFIFMVAIFRKLEDNLVFDFLFMIVMKVLISCTENPIFFAEVLDE